MEKRRGKERNFKKKEKFKNMPYGIDYERIAFVGSLPFGPPLEALA